MTQPTPADCPAPTHTSEWSVRHGCTCPDAVARARLQRDARVVRGRLRKACRIRLAEVSDVAVYLAKHGHADEATPAERRIAAMELIAAGLSKREAARRLGVADRTVYRYFKAAA